jgi:hypothetical protein
MICELFNRVASHAIHVSRRRINATMIFTMNVINKVKQARGQKNWKLAAFAIDLNQADTLLSVAGNISNNVVKRYQIKSLSSGGMKDAPTSGVTIGGVASMKQSVACPVGPPHSLVIKMNPLPETLQVAHCEVEVLSFSFKTMDIRASAHQSGKAKAADVHAYVDDDVIGGKRLRQTIIVACNDTQEYG